MCHRMFAATVFKHLLHAAVLKERPTCPVTVPSSETSPQTKAQYRRSIVLSKNCSLNSVSARPICPGPSVPWCLCPNGGLIPPRLGLLGKLGMFEMVENAIH